MSRFGQLAMVAVLASALPGQASDKRAERMIPVIGEPISVHVDEVRSIGPEERVGFSKSLPVYHVFASGEKAVYSVYCVRHAPESGKTYSAEIDFMDGSLSWLKMWPEERKNLNLHAGQSTKGRVYRMMLFHDVSTGKYSDVACDIKSETAKH